jgi:integrase
METGKARKTWERTPVTNLLRNGQSGTYYARIKISGKQKWRTLDTKVFTVAKLRLADVKREERSKASMPATSSAAAETATARYIQIHRERVVNKAGLKDVTRSRLEIAVKALLKTWPDLPTRDVRRITAEDCREWAARALRDGTGFVPPGAKPNRRGMSASSLNKTMDVLRSVLEIAKEHGLIYHNVAAEMEKKPVPMKRLVLPTVAQFHAIVKTISEAGARQSRDCADMVRLLAFSGARLSEAVALRWHHVDEARGLITIPGTKSSTSYRTVPLFPPLASLLKEMRARRGEEPADAHVLAVNECAGALRNACTAVGIKPIGHHDLRYFFATVCIENGVDIPLVSRWLGHSDGGALAMKTYGHLRQEHSMASAAKVNFGGAM